MRPVFRRAVVTTLATAAIAAGGAAPALASGDRGAVPAASSSTVAGLTQSGTRIALFAPDWDGAASKRSAAAWQQAAKTHDVLIGLASVYRKWVTQLHGWNPNLKAIQYDLGPYTTKGSSTFSTLLSQHPDYFAHDSKGNLINDAPSFPGNYLMDVGNAGYRSYKAALVRSSVAASGLDGIDLDSMGDGPFQGYTDAVPFNPATHKLYTVSEWLTGGVGLINAVKAALGTKITLFNGFKDGQDYFAASHILATSNADGGIGELWLRGPTSPARSYPSTTDWLLDIRMVADIASHHMAFFGWTKLWSTATSAQKAAWDTFTMASYLMARTGLTYINFLPDHSADRTAVFYPNELTDIGSSLDAATQSGSSWIRKFQHGTVKVTPGSGASALITVS